MTITIKEKTFTSNLSLAAIMNVMTKVEMLKICDKLELYVSPNLKKDETARRVAREILDMPEKGQKLPSKKQLRLIAALHDFMGGNHKK